GASAADRDNVVGFCEGCHASRERQRLQDIDLRIHDEHPRFQNLPDHVHAIADDLRERDGHHGLGDIACELGLDLATNLLDGASCGLDFPCKRERELTIWPYDDGAL